MSHFKARNGLKQFKLHGIAGLVEPERVEREKRCIQEVIYKYGYKLNHIFNMDETEYSMSMYLLFYFGSSH